MKDLAGKVGFVTGGASGIGFALARTLTQAGMKVVIADRNPAHLEEASGLLANEGGEHLAIALDVTDREAWVAAADKAEARFGRIHLLCNNAGIGTAMPIDQADYDVWDSVLAVNLGGVINGVVTMLPRLRAHGEGGHVVNVASMAAIAPLGASGGIYTASKFAVRGLSDSLRLALIPDRIGVSCVFPGLTRTRLLDERKAKMAAEGKVDASTAAFISAQDSAMDPMDLARAIVDAVRENRAYVIVHHEFATEIEREHSQLMAAIRYDIPADPKRVAFEEDRCRQLHLLADQAEAW